MGDSNPLVNIDLTKPVTTLIERLFNAAGGALQPWQMKRVANADIEVEALRQRSVHRLELEALAHQKNIESVLTKAVPLLEELEDPQEPAQDWFTDFCGKCRNISDEEMQKLWAQLLAGEAKRPGSYSKRALTVLADLEKEDADAFSMLCCMEWWSLRGRGPVVLSLREGQDKLPLFYPKYRIDEAILLRLESLGLIYNNRSPIPDVGMHGQENMVAYFDEFFKVHPSSTINPQFGNVSYTAVGSELSHLTKKAKNLEYLKDIGAFWEAKGWRLEIAPYGFT